MLFALCPQYDEYADLVGIAAETAAAHELADNALKDLDSYRDLWEVSLCGGSLP